MMGKLNKYIIVGYILVFIAGLSLGWFLFHQPNKSSEQDDYTALGSESTIWTCPMHQELRLTKPGKCPKCSTDLIPLVSQDIHENGEIDTASVYFNKESLELADVQTSVVTRKNPTKEIRLYGKVQVNDLYISKQTAPIRGRIENLMVSSTGESVRKGQTLALIYSPELVVAQQALLDAALKKGTDPEAYHSAKNKLYKWNLTDAQISDIIKRDRVKTSFELIASTSGIVTSRLVNNGDYVGQGEVLYKVADLSRLWVIFDAYESDLPFLNVGDQISFSLKSLPGTNFTANISFVDPVINAETRVSKVRVEIENASGKMKPEMFAAGLVQANLSEYRDKLVIPELAVMWIGKRSFVYVKEEGRDVIIFKIREVKLGPVLGNSYVVASGLNEGEDIVTQGAFKVNVAAKQERQSRQ
ncbi:MAG: efflux RND transporter periplasmic adaptor subunit [Bacteroidales bacterium]|nr:efflux RND transporter periplasmic adaptor subunit [Bacteroidales bacterium]